MDGTYNSVMRIWKIIHAMRVNFGFLTLGLLIAEGVLAFPLMFIFPPASLLLVFLGLATIALSFPAQGLLSLIDNWLARLLGIEMPPLEGDETSMP